MPLFSFSHFPIMHMYTTHYSFIMIDLDTTRLDFFLCINTMNHTLNGPKTMRYYIQHNGKVEGIQWGPSIIVHKEWIKTAGIQN